MPLSDAIPPVTLIADDEFVIDAFDRREDLSVQVKLTKEGEWHRKAVGGHAIACTGARLGFYASRDEQYTGKMCQDGCFTKYELSLIPSPANAPDKK